MGILCISFFLFYISAWKTILTFGSQNSKVYTSLTGLTIYSCFSNIHPPIDIIGTQYSQVSPDIVLPSSSWPTLSYLPERSSNFTHFIYQEKNSTYVCLYCRHHSPLFSSLFGPNVLPKILF